MRVKKKIELWLIRLLAMISPVIARSFTFRKATDLTFSSFKTKQQGEVEILLMPYFLKKDSVFIDIGANKGLYCYYAEKIIPENNIIAFEPVPSISVVLKLLFPKARIVRKAVSDTKGTATLSIPVHKQNYLIDTRSTLERNSPELSGNFETIQVKITTLDQELENFNIKNIGLIKADVEGHEIKLIRGAKKTLIEKRPYLIIEIDLINHNNDLSNAFKSINELDYLIYYFELDSLTLKPAYNPQKDQFLPLSISGEIHNYVCFPKENEGYVNEVNSAIHKRLKSA